MSAPSNWNEGKAAVVMRCGNCQHEFSDEEKFGEHICDPDAVAVHIEHLETIIERLTAELSQQSAQVTELSAKVAVIETKRTLTSEQIIGAIYKSGLVREDYRNLHAVESQEKQEHDIVFFAYKGPAYNRPCGRGICIGEDMAALDEKLPDGDFYIEIIANKYPCQM